MSYHRQSRKTARSLFAAALVLVCALGTVVQVAAQKITSPTTPVAITPPAGNSAFLVGHAVGTQGYVCLPTSTGASWTVNGSRPEATLFEDPAGGAQILTHFLSPDASPSEFAPNPLPVGSPTWQSSADSSLVWAKALTPPLSSGADASCPNAGAIPCLLLQSIGSKTGPNGGKAMTKTTYVQRLNTKGGSAPAAGCSASADVGKQALVPYTADYYFFRKN